MPRSKGPRPFYSVQTIFQDDTIAPIDEADDVVDIEASAPIVSLTRPAPAVMASASKAANPARGFSSSAWSAMASRFAPLDTQERKARKDNVFEDDTVLSIGPERVDEHPLPPHRESPHGVHTALRGQVGDLFRSHSGTRKTRAPASNASASGTGPANAVDQPSHSTSRNQHLLSPTSPASSRYHSVGPSGQTAPPLLPLAAAALPRQKAPSQRSRSSSLFSALATSDGASTHAPAMPSAARALVREAIERVPAQPAGPNSRLGRAQDDATPNSARKEGTRAASQPFARTELLSRDVRDDEIARSKARVGGSHPPRLSNDPPALVIPRASSARALVPSRTTPITTKAEANLATPGPSSTSQISLSDDTREGHRHEPDGPGRTRR